MLTFLVSFVDHVSPSSARWRAWAKREERRRSALADGLESDLGIEEDPADARHHRQRA